MFVNGTKINMKFLSLSLLLMAGSIAARADLAGTLIFTDPTETVAATDAIPVQLTLGLDPTSDALITDASGNVTTLTSAQIAANLFNNLPGGVDENSATRSNLNVAFGCSGNFTSVCTSGPPYDFAFNFSVPSLVAPTNLNQAPGTSDQYLFGTFTPTDGVAPPGTYTFTYAAVFVQVWDDNLLQDPGNPSSGALHIADVPIADTFSSESTFTRTVPLSPVPEPSSYLVLGTLAGLLAFVRHRRAFGHR